MAHTSRNCDDKWRWEGQYLCLNSQLVLSFTEVQPPFALTLNSMFAEYTFAYPHSRNSYLVEMSKPRTPSTHVIAKSHGCSRCACPCVFFIYFFTETKTKQTKVLFPFSLRAQVTSSSEIWYVLMSQSYILTASLSTRPRILALLAG